MTHSNGMKLQGERLHRALRPVMRPAAEQKGSETPVDDIRNDTTAECRWWNDLAYQERLAYVGGAKGSPECAQNDWLDIGETNRLRILDAAHAVQCWLTAVNDD